MSELVSQISESLAGRIAIVELGTLKTNEYYHKPLSDFYHVFTDTLSRKNLISGTVELNRDEIETLWLRGGYPEPIIQADDFYFRQWMENYQETYIQRDIARLFPRLNKTAFQRFITMLSKLSGTIINKSDLVRALEISEKAVREYIHIAEGTFIWRS